MPKRSGFLVLEGLHRTQERKFRVIMVTGNEGERHKAYAEMLGWGDDYMRKPFAIDRLLDSVQRWLNEPFFHRPNPKARRPKFHHHESERATRAKARSISSTVLGPDRHGDSRLIQPAGKGLLHLVESNSLILRDDLGDGFVLIAKRPGISYGEETIAWAFCERRCRSKFC